MTFGDVLEQVWADKHTHHSLLDIAGDVLPFYHQRPHTDLLAAVLTDAVTRAENGEDVRLIVQMPPGQGKSSICSVGFPLWALSRHPDWEVVLVSAEASLAAKWSRDCRRSIQEGHVPGVTLSRDTQAQTEWETTSGGGLIARGVGGQITGRRARVMVIDDPVKNLTDAHSPFQRQVLWETWQSVLKTRLRPGSVAVLVMTRWHQDDLAGRLIGAGGWDVLSLPAIAETGDDRLGRTTGEPLLSPQTDETIEQALARWEQTRTEVGTYVWDALYQQRPAPPGGSVFVSDWWQWHTRTTLPHPTEGEWLTSWDLTFGSQTDTGDWCVGQVWQHHDGTAYLVDQRRGRWTFTEQLAHMKQLAADYPQAGTHLVEKAANGAAAIDTLKREIKGITPVRPTGSKVVRAHSVTPQCEAGQVSLPSDRSWSDALVGELTGFPTGVHDDQVDALTQALERFKQPRHGTITTNPALVSVSSGAGGFRGRS